MSLHAWVVDGAEVSGARREWDTPPAAKATGAKWLPVETEYAELSAGQRYGAVVTTVEAERVLDSYPAEDKPLDKIKAEKKAAIDAEFNARMATGYPVPDSVETLQLRNAEDKANWLTLKDACEDAIAAGAGASTCTLPPRTTANNFVSGTWGETKALMQSMRVWGGAMLGTAWALKDAVEQAEDAATVLAIDETVGWP